MIEINNNREYINVFGSINEVVKYITTRDTKYGRDTSSLERGDSWYGTNTFEEAIDKITHGDDELYNTILKEIDKLKIDKMLGNVSNRQKYVNRPYGCIPNISAYLTNNPMNMINPEKKEISHRIVNIFINTRVGGGTNPEEVVKIGSKYLAVIDLLEKAGYRCNLYSGCANCGTTDSILMVKVKTDKEPFNLKKICFTIASPAMQRRIKFRWMEVNDCKEDYTHHGYGGTCWDEKIKDLLSKTNQDYIIWNYERNNNTFTVEEILKELEEQGIKIN